MSKIRIGKRVVPLWLVVVLIISTVGSSVLAYYVWKTITISLEVKEPLEILHYPSQLSLYPGETKEFNVTIQNHAIVDYFVALDFRLSNTTYQTSYVTVSNEIYTVIPGVQNLTAWIIVESSAPLISASLTIDFMRVGTYVAEYTQQVYNFTQSLPSGSIVIESFDFGPSTSSENRRQAKAHIFHARHLGLKVVTLAFWSTGATVGESILKEVYGPNFPNIPEYGISIVYLGYVAGNEVGMQTFGDDTWTAKGIDHYGTSVSALPLMQQCKSAADFDLWAEWTSGDPGITQVIQFIQGRHGGPSAVPIVCGATSISVPGIMPYYRSGQIVGILNGTAGAREYEYLLNLAYGYPILP